MKNNLNFDFIQYLHQNNTTPNQQSMVNNFFSDNCMTKGKKHEYFEVSKKRNQYNFNNNKNSLNDKITYNQCRNCFVIEIINLSKNLSKNN